MFKKTGYGKPIRFIVGGLHGSEGYITEPILIDVSKEVRRGSLILCNLTKKSVYVSTLNLGYYQTKIGKTLLLLIRIFKPEIYIELHSYRRKLYSKLTDPNRKLKMGVPPLIDLDDGILIGSVSPHIRTTEFKKYDLCLTIEIPSDLTYKYKVINILNMAILSRDKIEFYEKLREKYPVRVRIAEKTFYEYLKEIE